MKSRIKNNSLELTKIIWDLILMNTLHNEFGFGEKRIKKFYESFREFQKWFTEYACSTDEKKETYTNMDAAIIRLINDLDDIDWKEILNIDTIIYNGKDITKIADICKSHNYDRGR